MGRRAMLRGALLNGAAVAVGLPVLEIMLNAHGTAMAGGEPLPVRLVTWFFGNGVNRKRWIPGGMFTPIEGPDYPVPEHMTALSALKQYISVPTGYRNMCANKITHHEGMTLFNGYTFDQTCPENTSECFKGFYSNAGGPTIDQVAADYLGDKTPVRSMQLGVSKRRSSADFGTTMHTLSHRSATEPLPPQHDPQKIHYSLFGNISMPNDPGANTRMDVLSAVREQARRLDKKLGVQDHQRLEAHLQGISELETKIRSIKPPECIPPDKPSEKNEDVNGVEPLEEVNAVMSDLLAYAFTCDFTRVASVLFHEGASDTHFADTGGLGHHENSHAFLINEQGNEEDFGGLDGFNRGLSFTMSQLAYFLTKLADTEDGAGNLLDNSAILVGSDCMDGWSHDFDEKQNIACLVAGRAGGRLVHPGIHLIQEQRNVCDVALTVLKAVVPEVESIGDVGVDPAASSQPIQELLA